MSTATQIKGHPFTSKDFIDTFIQAVINTHKVTCNAEVSLGKPVVKPEFEPHGEVVGIVGIVANDMKWVLLVAYSKDAATELYRSLFDEKKDTVDKEVIDMVAEMTNQIYGVAKSILNQRGYNFEMAIPTVISGNFETRLSGAGATLTIPFQVKTNSAHLWIDITLEKTKPSIKTK